MTKKLLATLLFLSLSATAQIPNWTWAKNITLSSNDSRNRTASDSQGNVYVVGTFTQPTITFGTTTLTNNSTNPIFWDFYLVKYNRDGVVVWAKSFGGPGADGVTSLVTDAQGNIYLVGLFQESFDFGGIQLTTTYAQSFWAKLSPDGDVIWAKTGDASNLMNLSSLAVDSSGQVYLSGTYSSPTLSVNGQTLITYEGYVENETRSRPFVMKTDANGDAVWGRAGQSAHTNVMGCEGYDAAVDNDGNVFLVGRFNVDNITFGTHTLIKTTSYVHSSNMFVVKYDSNGVAQWAKSAGTIYENNTHANGVEVDASGNAYVVGFFSNTISWDGVSVSSGGGSYGFLVKFNPQGVAQWAKTPQGGSGAINYHDIDLDDEGNVYIAGSSWVTPLSFGNGVTLSTSGEGLAFVTKYNPQGQAIWGRKADPMSVNNRVALSVVSPNEIYMAGEFSNSALTFAPYTIFRDTSTAWNLFLARLYYEPLSLDEHEQAMVKLYPNPSTGLINLETTSGINISQTQIFDLNGRTVLSTPVNGQTATLDVGHLQSGIYLLEAESDRGKQRFKIVKE